MYDVAFDAYINSPMSYEEIIKKFKDLVQSVDTNLVQGIKGHGGNEPIKKVNQD